MNGGLTNASDREIYERAGVPAQVTDSKTRTEEDAEVKAATFADSPELRYHRRFSVSKVNVCRKLRFCM